MTSSTSTSTPPTSKAVAALGARLTSTYALDLARAVAEQDTAAIRQHVEADTASAAASQLASQAAAARNAVRDARHDLAAAHAQLGRGSTASDVNKALDNLDAAERAEYRLAGDRPDSLGLRRELSLLPPAVRELGTAVRARAGATAAWAARLIEEAKARELLGQPQAVELPEWLPIEAVEVAAAAHHRALDAAATLEDDIAKGRVVTVGGIDPTTGQPAPTGYAPAQDPA